MQSHSNTSGHSARSANARKRSRLQLSITELLESRMHLSASVEPIDGVGNNMANPTWGSMGTDRDRLAAAAYADGIDSPALPADQQRTPLAVSQATDLLAVGDVRNLLFSNGGSAATI